MRGLNPSIVVFVDGAAETIRPGIEFGNYRGLFSLLNYSSQAPDSAHISMLEQLIASVGGKLDPRVGLGVDVYCAALGEEPDAMAECLRQIDVAAHGHGFDVRTHCFAFPSAQGEAAWSSVYRRLSTSTNVRGGRVCLVTTRFRDREIDRLRSHAVLRRLIAVYALTETSRHKIGETFTGWRAEHSYGFYHTAIEGYRWPEPMECAEYLYDVALWSHLQPRFSNIVRAALQAYPAPTERISIEDWLLTEGRMASSYAELLNRLTNVGRNAPPCRLADKLAVNGGRAWAGQSIRPKPSARPSHSFEDGFAAIDDAALLSLAYEEALDAISRFPLPIHPFLPEALPSSGRAELVQHRKESIARIAELGQERFYQWALQQHWEWLPPNRASVAYAKDVQHALGVASAEPRMPRVTVHVDHCVTKDEREEIRQGPDRIEMLYFVPVGVN